MQSLPALRDVPESNALVEAKLHVVPWVVNRLLPHSPGLQRLGFDDACQVGYLGLIRAAELWAPQRGTFSTYAVRAIRRRLLHAALCSGGVIRVPSWVHRSGAGRCYADAERANRFGPLPEDVLGLESPAASTLDASEDVAAAISALDRLPRRQADIVRRVVMHGESCAAVARDFGLTRERVRQLKVAGLMALRSAFGR
jgi:RNA polymerase sigma factor (sigma-70 family)